MDRVTVTIDTEGGSRPSEILADLRAVAETLYFPMRLVGFWDSRADIHLCPQEERREPCLHRLDTGDADRVDYEVTISRERRGSLHVSFPHAGLAIYLA
jgi:hypothetical protein